MIMILINRAQEKYINARVSIDEWQKIVDKYKNLVAKEELEKNE